MFELIQLTFTYARAKLFWLALASKENLIWRHCLYLFVNDEIKAKLMLEIARIWYKNTAETFCLNSTVTDFFTRKQETPLSSWSFPFIFYSDNWSVRAGTQPGWRIDIHEIFLRVRLVCNWMAFGNVSFNHLVINKFNFRIFNELKKCLKATENFSRIFT